MKQPVFVSDVATGIVAACTDRDAVGQTYQAVGSVFLTVTVTLNKPIPFATCVHHNRLSYFKTIPVHSTNTFPLIKSLECFRGRAYS